MDVLEWAKNYQGPKFHAILTDPPYNLDSIKKRFGRENSKPAKEGRDGAFTRIGRGFMGKAWDTDVAFDPEVWYAIGEHLYPGAFGLAYMGSRTYHRCAVAIEEAGFIIHPMIGWIQAQGLPKATRVDIQVDKREGVESERVPAAGRWSDSESETYHWNKGTGYGVGKYMKKVATSDLGKEWEGYMYGLQSLKPCLEPIIMFQKPYENTPVDDMLDSGAGALNIEATKFSVGREIITNRFTNGMKPFGNAVGEEYASSVSDLLYPANVILYGDVGEPFENFFYNAKVTKKEKNLGLDEPNMHPTVKPIQLNKYLALLLLPPSIYAPRRLLVPFAGTASEMIGGLQAGWDEIVGIELEKESAIVARKRIEYWSNDAQA
jgi:site-specific DNA-methyltransferase (adenine-specific)